MPDKKIALGSGHLYAVEITSSVKLTSAMTISELETFLTANAISTNILGYIKGGATFNYSQTTYTEKDDFSEVTKTAVTDESVSLGAGLITFDTGMLSKIISTSDVTNGTSSDAGKSLLKLGGINNDNGKKYVLIFVHEDVADGDIIIAIHGKNTAAIALQFQQGAGTLSNPTFTGEPFDSAGRSAFIYTRPHPTTTSGGDES